MDRDYLGPAFIDSQSVGGRQVNAVQRGQPHEHLQRRLVPLPARIPNQANPVPGNRTFTIITGRPFRKLERSSCRFYPLSSAQGWLIRADCHGQRFSSARLWAQLGRAELQEFLKISD